MFDLETGDISVLNEATKYYLRKITNIHQNESATNCRKHFFCVPHKTQIVRNIEHKMDINGFHIKTKANNNSSALDFSMPAIIFLYHNRLFL